MDRVLLVAVASCGMRGRLCPLPGLVSLSKVHSSKRSTDSCGTEGTGAARRPCETYPNLPCSSEGRGRRTRGGDGHVPLSTRRRNGHPSHPTWPARVPSFDSGERARASRRGDVPRGRHHGGEPTGDPETHRPPQGGSRRVVRGGRHDLTRPPVRFIPGFSLPL